tara:strand:- start:66 stop:905 length:840 start_codon:yes stop_codon:yes gene_type:complete
MKAGIIGCGFVGCALAEGIKSSAEILKVDPKLGTNISDLCIFNPDLIFICLPTPMALDGTIDISIIENALIEIKELNLTALIIIKSTIHPGNIEEIEKKFPDFVYNPEFLREQFAYEDFVNSDLIVFGGEKRSCKILAKFYENYTKCKNKEFMFTDAKSASLIKYAINSFLATKIIFFNELKELFDNIGTNENWDVFTKLISIDKRIGDSHMKVPGDDGKYGFGGACFPKDTSAFLKYAESRGIKLNLIKNVINTNNQIRAKYNVTEREKEQNINYTKK